MGFNLETMKLMEKTSGVILGKLGDIGTLDPPPSPENWDICDLDETVPIGQVNVATEFFKQNELHSYTNFHEL